jgi:polyhydroxyalkanoate synthesis regulator phasin
MANTYRRDNQTGALVNTSASAYQARQLAKARGKQVEEQKTKIATLESELEALKARVTTLENNSPS